VIFDERVLTRPRVALLGQSGMTWADADLGPSALAIDPSRAARIRRITGIR
jgi:hypothetical protein